MPMTRLLTMSRLLVLICVLLLISSMLPARLAGAVSGLPHRFVSLLLTPVTYQLRNLSMAIRPSVPDELLANENRNWQQQFLDQRQYTALLAEEVKRLQNQLSAFERIDAVMGDVNASFISARVSGNHHHGGKATLSIDRGDSAGFVQGNAVVHGEQLVGQIEQVGWKTSDVQLLTTAETLLKVRVLAPGSVDFAQVVVRPAVGGEAEPVWIRLNKNGDAFTCQESAMTPIQKGDLAQLSDERWPREAQGFFVGQVTSVTPDPSNPQLYKIVTIKPRYELTTLHDVTVLVPGKE